MEHEKDSRACKNNNIPVNISPKHNTKITNRNEYAYI